MKVSYSSIDEAWGLSSSPPSNSPNSNRKSGNGDAYQFPLVDKKSEVNKQKWSDFIQQSNMNQNKNKNRNSVSESFEMFKNKFPNASYQSDVHSQFNKNNHHNKNSNNNNRTKNTNHKKLFAEHFNNDMNSDSINDEPQDYMFESQSDNFSDGSSESEDDIPLECTEHLRHFIECRFCNKAIRKRIEQYINLENKENANNKQIFNSFEHFSNLSSQMSPQTQQPQQTSWMQYTGEFLLLIFIGILLIFILDMFIKLGSKSKSS
jgi:hypothetical protein